MFVCWNDVEISDYNVTLLILYKAPCSSKGGWEEMWFSVFYLVLQLLTLYVLLHALQEVIGVKVRMPWRMSERRQKGVWGQLKEKKKSGMTWRKRKTHLTETFVKPDSYFSTLSLKNEKQKEKKKNSVWKSLLNQIHWEPMPRGLSRLDVSWC